MKRIVDTILHNASVLTMDASYQVYEPGAVAVLAGEIQAIGNNDVILEGYSAGEIIDCEGKVLMPGLVNAHTHVPMTLLRGLADYLLLDVWLM